MLVGVSIAATLSTYSVSIQPFPISEKKQYGSESFAVDKNGSIAHIVMPAKQGGVQANRQMQAFYKKTTYAKGSHGFGQSQESQINIGDSRTRIRFPAERIVYVNEDFRNYETRSQKQLPDGTYLVRVRYNYDPKNIPTHHLVDLYFNNKSCTKLLRADHFQSSYIGPPYLMKKFFITSHREVGGKFINEKILVEHYQKNKIIAEWNYTLKSVDEIDLSKPEAMFEKGEKIIDSRLGNDKQVEYDWTGTLPTMDELASMRNQIDKPIFGVAKPMTAIWAGVGLLLGAIGFAVIRHKSSEAKKKV